MNHTLLTFVIAIPVFLIVVYLSVRLGSSAYYRSKKEYIQHYFSNLKKELDK